MSPWGQPHPLSLVKSDSSSSAARFWVAAVKSEITDAAEDMAVLNSAIWVFMPDVVLELFAGPLPGVLPGCKQLPMLGF